MPLLVTHTTAADGTFSTAGAAAWNASHTISGTINLATETTGTINLLTQTSGATANRLLYGGASGEAAQSAGMVWNNATSLLTVGPSGAGGSGSLLVGGNLSLNTNGIAKTINSLLDIRGGQLTTGSGNGGGVDLRGGNGLTLGGGGDVYMRGGIAAGTGAASTSGGAIVAFAGDASITDTAGFGGYVSFKGGSSYGATGAAGYAEIAAGDDFSATGGTAASASLSGGSCYNGAGIPGDITLGLGGQSTGSTVGKIIIQSAFSDPVAVAAGTGTTHAADLPVTVDGTQYYIRLYS